MTSISVLKKIYTLLHVKSITDLVGNNLYPLIAPEGTTFPFIIYTKGNLTPMYSKGYRCGDRVTVEIAVADDKYITTVEIAEEIRKILERHRDDFFSEITLQNVYEEFQNDAYIQTLEFECTIL